MSDVFVEQDLKLRSPKVGNHTKLHTDEDELDVNYKPNQVEKISLALENGLRAIENESKSVMDDANESLSVKEEFDTYSDNFNDKVRHEIDILQSDLKKLRIDYDELCQQNMNSYKALSAKEDQLSNLEKQMIELKKDKTELLIVNKNYEKEIKDLTKRRNAAKMEIMNLNKRLEKMSTKISTSDLSFHNDPFDKSEEVKNTEEIEKQLKVAEHNFSRSLRILTKLKKSIEDIYKEYINLLIHAEETNSSCKKLVYDIERELNGLKISINEYFDDITIAQNAIRPAGTPKISRNSVLSQNITDRNQINK